MTRQLEDTEDSHEANHSKYSKTHGLIGRFILRWNRSSWQVQSVFFFSNNGGQSDEVGDDSYYVYYIHHVSKEVELIRTGQKPYYQFKSEPDNTERFYQEEWVGNIWHFVFLDFGSVGGSIEYFVVFEFR